MHLRLYLEAAEASLEDVVEMTSYHVDLRQHLDAFMAAKDRHIAAPYPAWSAIGVSQLITEGHWSRSAPSLSIRDRVAEAALLGIVL